MPYILSMEIRSSVYILKVALSLSHCAVGLMIPFSLVLGRQLIFRLDGKNGIFLSFRRCSLRFFPSYIRRRVFHISVINYLYSTLMISFLHQRGIYHIYVYRYADGNCIYRKILYIVLWFFQLFHSKERCFGLVWWINC